MNLWTMLACHPLPRDLCQYDIYRRGRGPPPSSPRHWIRTSNSVRNLFPILTIPFPFLQSKPAEVFANRRTLRNCSVTNREKQGCCSLACFLITTPIPGKNFSFSTNRTNRFRVDSSCRCYPPLYRCFNVYIAFFFFIYLLICLFFCFVLIRYDIPCN